MPPVKVDTLVYTFRSHMEYIRYDSENYYKKKFQKVCPNIKAVDLVAYCKDAKILWLIESTDYRTCAAMPKLEALADEVASKAVNTLAGLVGAYFTAECKTAGFAKNWLPEAGGISILLCMELPPQKSRIKRFPKENLVLRLKQKLKPVGKFRLRSMQNPPEICVIAEAP